MIGKPPIIVTNEYIVPMCVAVWYFTHYLGGAHLLNYTPAKIVWTVLAMLFRTHTVSNIVDLANATLTATPGYYSVPLIGPIIVGTTLGSFGMFMPLEKGVRSRTLAPFLFLGD